MRKWEEIGKEKIKCCPFCGSAKVDIARTNVNACWVECAECGGQTQSRKHREAAIALWNIRFDKLSYAEIVQDDDLERAAR